MVTEQDSRGPEFAHYTAYRPRPFRKHERDRVTILFGGLTWKHERLIQGVFHNLGYQAEPLPNVARSDLDAGKELIDVGACCPTQFVTGNLVNFLRAKMSERGKRSVLDDYLYFTAGACGACRFGQYHQSYSMALETLGLSDFRILLMAQDELNQESDAEPGLKLDPPFTMGLLWALLCGDLLTDLEYMTRPYEVEPGSTNRVLRESAELLYRAFRTRPVQGGKWSSPVWHLLTGHFTKALREVRRQWDSIEVDRLRVKPKVEVTGEFWLQTHEGDGNYNIKAWLESEGAEVSVPPVAVWLDYLMRFHAQEWQDRRGIDRRAALKVAALRALQRIYRSAYDRLRRSLDRLTPAMPDQSELRRLAAPYFHHRLSGGEGDMLIGKALHAHLHRTAHMTCELTPYSCLPNTMSIGAMANVLGKHPRLLYAPIEVKGHAEVHALSRCQMVLTDAKLRAQREFDRTMAETGLSLRGAREREAAHPFARRAGCRIPHRGVAGTAARYLRHLSEIT